ncbi:RNA polymerase, sigma-24 subunit, ECF subfamily [Leptothrix cholodnii SP-6]|uniref:RNA polymerase, sigma-24 subunit, ECF subfamily n=1 Tax=Leptothrix cholodnii (strain ATCC 51168 / LMG 8142 / SP-6) TaxID=395495 RepID=B1Y5F1_LEPCP|nr:RNA polymerase, sigma-24 subunit, ECF subfamily [Leptothrix cholodnii SP-6]
MHADRTEFDYEAALAACAAGDRKALSALYDQEGARMLGVALRVVRRRELAEDIVHDACVAIWQRAASFDPARGSGRGWIYTVVRNLALDAVRASSRDVDLDDTAVESREAELALDAHRDIAEAFELNASLGRLRTCLAALDAPRRNCVLHAYVDGCSHGEIAERLGAPLGTVKAWIRRSLLALRECMA